MSEALDSSGSNLLAELPRPGRNKLWFRSSRGGSVIIFVHGVLSDFRNCWMYNDKERSAYWPSLIVKDPRFRGVGVYLGGYYTSVDAGSYDLRNSADELFNGLQRKSKEGELAVLSQKNLIFVCHSTGGIVVRYMLVNNYKAFVDKTLGLVLIASPSYGSRWADWLGLLLSVYGHKVGEQLKEGSWSLRDLDAQFKNLVNERMIPKLFGVEAYENYFILHRKWLPDRNVVVTQESAGRYFGAPVLLRNTDHFSSVKPDGFEHPAYELLVDFCQKHPEFSANISDESSSNRRIYFHGRG